MTNITNLFKLFSLFVLVILLNSCVNTRISSMKDPNVNGKTFKRIMIVGGFADQNYQIASEQILASELEKRNVFYAMVHKELPPIRSYTNDEIRQVYSRLQVDACLSVVPTEADIATINRPTVSNTKIKNDRLTTTTYNGGQTQVIRGFNYKAELSDLSTGNVVWQAIVNIQPGELSEIKDIFFALCEKIIAKLEEDKLIVPEPKTRKTRE